MTVIRELVTILGFQTDEAGLKKAEAGFKTLLKSSAAIVAGAGAVVAGLFAITKATADAGDAARDSAKRTGLTAEAVQELGYAAQQSGVSTGELESGLKFLQKASNEAGKGSKGASASFAALGVKIRDAGGKIKPTEQLFGEVSDRLASMKDPAQRTALAMKIFGREGTQLLPLLLEGSKGINEMRERAEALGFVMSTEAADASDRFNDSLTDLSLAATGISRRLGTKLLPIFNKVIDAVTNLIVENRELIDKGIDALVGAVDSLVTGLGRMLGFIDKNREFFAILTAIGVLPLVKALGLLFWAQLKVIAGPALAVVGWLAFAAVLALVAEDIYKFVTGGKSLLGDLFAEFLDKPAKANEHWMVNVLRTVLDLIRQSITGWKQLIGLFEGEVEIDGRKVKLGEATTPESWQFGHFDPKVRERLQEPPKEGWFDRLFGFGEGPFGTGPRPGDFDYAAKTGSTTINQTFELPPNASPTQVGTAAADGTKRGLKQAHDETRPRVLR